jgi:hypothetical protein
LRVILLRKSIEDLKVKDIKGLLMCKWHRQFCSNFWLIVSFPKVPTMRTMSIRSRGSRRQWSNITSLICFNTFRRSAYMYRIVTHPYCYCTQSGNLDLYWRFTICNTIEVGLALCPKWSLLEIVPSDTSNKFEWNSHINRKLRIPRAWCQWETPRDSRVERANASQHISSWVRDWWRSSWECRGLYGEMLAIILVCATYRVGQGWIVVRQVVHPESS